MPVKTCSFDALVETVEGIEADGGRLISVATANERTAVVAYYLPKAARATQGDELRRAEPTRPDPGITEKRPKATR